MNQKFISLPRSFIAGAQINVKIILNISRCGYVLDIYVMAINMKQNDYKPVNFKYHQQPFVLLLLINNKEWLENLNLFLNKTSEYCKENNSE